MTAPRYQLSENERELFDGALDQISHRVCERENGVIHTTPVDFAKVEEAMKVAKATLESAALEVQARGAEIDRLQARVAAMKADQEATVMDREKVRSVLAELERSVAEDREAMTKMAEENEALEQRAVALEHANRSLRSKLAGCRPAIVALRSIAQNALEQTFIAGDGQ